MIKVCGMTRPEDVRLCAEAGADLLGFIFHPASPRFVTPDFPASLEPEALGQARKVGVFVKESVVEVRHTLDEARLDYVQLHGGQDQKFCRSVGFERVIKVFWPERYASLDELAEDMARFADCALFLLDAGTSGGGHGRSLDFAALAKLDSPRPWLLAGGLGPKNVRAAVEACAKANLAGVDLNSGVESAPGLKDIEKVRTAIAACRR
ncbi:phosphoribosylanthranilate isomerase [Desulfocurvibacter africanus]|uniref:N-(5'-phosphoribosyl)anthranilate isomerase n=1 Tax=Desulfocurvibacter africanus subsp. africanus str. Walvis Bay TaxID=690850 RepID=F3Z2N6_DESAF|nr:phosphoribosylanthranilate isomerase [Desulfocurvibacter africanus]EGJ50203.1 N-(5'phosphoribosyl)anthranilate isomerase, PRAI [Desulfocurvibacter africanus subsp. africanus str. Walvis Bay]